MKSGNWLGQCALVSTRCHVRVGRHGNAIHVRSRNNSHHPNHSLTYNMGHDKISCRRDIPVINIPFFFVKPRRVFIQLPLSSKRNRNRLEVLKK